MLTSLGYWETSGWSYSNSSPIGLYSNSVEFTNIRWRSQSSYRYKMSKSYNWEINFENFEITGKRLLFYRPWLISTNNDFFIHCATHTSIMNITSGTISQLNYNTLPIDNLSKIIHYSNPSSDLNSTERVRFAGSSQSFGSNSRLRGFNFREIDWYIKGYAWSNNQLNEGWSYNFSNDEFKWNVNKSIGFRYPAGIYTYTQNITPNTLRYVPYTYTNYISKYIEFEKFNIYFNYTGTYSTRLYLSNDLPDRIGLSLVVGQQLKNIGGIVSPTQSVEFEYRLSTYQYLGNINQNGDYKFYNLSGKKYLIFVAEYSNTDSFTLQISNLKIEGGYSKTDNNNDFLLTTTNIYNEFQPLGLIGTSPQSSFDATVTTPQTLHESDTLIFGLTGGTGTYSGFFSNLYGTVSNVAVLNSKIGNGQFRSGIWENGIWNSGKRIDSEVKYFNDLEIAIKMNSSSTDWRIQIFGGTSSTIGLKVGDEVSISNIAIFDINDTRRTPTSKWRITSINSRRLVLETKSIFPIMRIEKDSVNHKIQVTRNIWLNGIFFNGIFSGIWNNGLVSGYPYLTKFQNTHWLSGDFRGGHFKSDKPQVGFVDTYYWEGNVGLTFGATAHGFIEGDIIEINKSDKSINPQYDGNYTVIKVVDQYLLITDRSWGQNTSGESGVVRSQATGLVQNVNFDSLNVSKRTSKDTQNLKEIWKYNSWMDLNWNDQSSTNINTDRTYFNNKPNTQNVFSMLNDIFDNNKFGLEEYSPLNLWGLTTDDVLKSESKFRNINNTLIKNYSLGTKWNIFEDYLGDISQFNETFGTSDEWGGLSNFFRNGWTFSYYSANLSSINTQPTLYRTIDGTFKYEAKDDDIGILLLNNNNVNIEKSRYSVIEFDYLSGPINILSTSQSGEIINQDFHYLDLFNFPVFSETDGNSIKWTNIDAFPQTIDLEWGDTGVFSKGISHKIGKKREFFYNRLGLDLGLFSFGLSTNKDLSSGGGVASQSYHFELDNIKFYEVDMIPFFNYTTEEYVNSDIQVPYFGIAPKIDSSTTFNFLENINLSLQGVILNKSDETITIPQLPNDGEADLLFR
jgi:hypothetical protein